MRSVMRPSLGIFIMCASACSAQPRRPIGQQSTVSSGDLLAVTKPFSVRESMFSKSSTHAPRRSVVSDNALAQYTLQQPDQQWTLPPTLREVSDISVLSDTEVACVQDERGSVFIYDLKRRSISAESHFGPKGDYEGLALTDSGPYVLRSDGRLFELSSLEPHPEVRTLDLQLPARDTEALCYDPGNGRLLIAPKSESGDGDAKEVRIIFGFDLAQKSIAPAPLWQISLHDIRRFAKSHGLPLPRRAKQGGQGMHTVLHFRPSAIAVHPDSREVYLLSAVDHVLVSCDRTGSITGYALLDSQLFRQPEGLTFFANGDLLISNEAAGKEPTLLLFRWQRKNP